MCLWVCMASDRLHMSIIQHLVIVELCFVALKFSYNCQLDNSLYIYVHEFQVLRAQARELSAVAYMGEVLELLNYFHVSNRPQESTYQHKAIAINDSGKRTHKEQRRQSLVFETKPEVVPVLTGSMKKIQQWKCGILTMHPRTSGDSWKSAGVGVTHAYNYWIHIYTWALLEIEG